MMMEHEPGCTWLTCPCCVANREMSQRETKRADYFLKENGKIYSKFAMATEDATKYRAERDLVVKNLAMFIKRLSRCVKKSVYDPLLCDMAIQYLSKHGLGGNTFLRDEETEE